MDFYLYQNWHRQRGKIHRGECPSCNHGRGIHEVDSGKYGKWLGPFSREEAFKRAGELGISDMTRCQKCDP